VGLENDSIFTDQRQFLAHMRAERPDQKGYEFVPGTQVDLDGGELTVTQTLYTPEEIDHIFDEKWATWHPSAIPPGRGHRRDRARGPSCRREMLAAIRNGGSRCCARAHDPHRRRRQRAVPHRRARHGRRLPEGEGARVRGGGVHLLVHDPRRPRLDEHRRSRDRLVELDLPVDAVRGGPLGKFNEFLTTFLKCLSRDRIEYVENWYAEQSDQTEDAEIDEWTVQRRCPHLRADLTKTGKIEDGVLTCALHDWKWDLASGSASRRRGTRSARRASSRRHPPPPDAPAEASVHGPNRFARFFSLTGEVVTARQRWSVPCHGGALTSGTPVHADLPADPVEEPVVVPAEQHAVVGVRGPPRVFGDVVDLAPPGQRRSPE
jgi:UDP-MurNAc hydroxylase